MTKSFTRSTMASIALCLIFSCLSLSSASSIKKISQDLTYVFDETTLNWPAHKKFEVLIKSNKTNEGGFWFQFEEYASSTHAGTHIDAPRHFSQNGWTVDQIPLSRLVAPAAVIDIVHRSELDPDAEVQVQDLQNWEKEAGRSLDGTVVMVYSGWGTKWADREAFLGSKNRDLTRLHYPGFSAEASKWLVENRQAYGIGTECLSFDPGTSKDFPAHRILLGSNLYGLENVANVDKIPKHGAILHVMPMKIGGASGAPTRIVAVFPESLKPAVRNSNFEKTGDDEL